MAVGPARSSFNANSIAGEQGAAQAAYTDLRTHAAALQALRDHLTASSRPKDVQDTQAQIELERVWTTNEAAQLTAINAAYAAQRDAWCNATMRNWRRTWMHSSATATPYPN